MRLGLRLDMFTDSLIGGAISALFSLLNKLTIVPEIGTHTSFTAGAGIVKNSDDFYQTLPTNCAKFEGARYADNLLRLTTRESEDLQVGWSGSGRTILNATQLITTSTSGFISAGGLGLSTTAGEVLSVRFEVSCDDATAKIRLNVTEAGVGGLLSSYELIGTGTTVATHNVTFVGGGTNITPVLQCDTSGVTITITKIQFEIKTSSDINKLIPSEYASVGVESSPYHGLGADGVKDFETELANTAASNIVTDVAGSVALTGLLGQSYNPLSTNLDIYSRAFGSWTGIGTPVVTQNQLGIDNKTNTAWTLDDNDAAAYEGILQGYTVASDLFWHTWSVRVLKDSDETRYPDFEFRLSGGTAQQVFLQVNTKTGASTVRTATGTYYTDVVDDGLWWIVSISLQNNNTGNITLETTIYPAVGDVWGAAAVTATGSIIVDASQVEKIGIDTSFIETSGSSVTRNAEVDRKVWPNNTQNNFKITCEFTHGGKDSSEHRYLLGAGAAAANSLRLIYVQKGTDKLACYISRTSNFFIVGTQVLTKGTTYTLRFEIVSDVCTLYVDDVQDGGTVDIGGDLVLAADSPLYIGSSYAGATGIKGNVYDVVVENL